MVPSIVFIKRGVGMLWQKIHPMQKRVDEIIEGTSSFSVRKSEVLRNWRAKNTYLQNVPIPKNQRDLNLVLRERRQFLITKQGFQGGQFSIL